MSAALTIRAGRVALAHLRERGWDPDAFSTLLGASGGPKWLVLSQIDRVLAGQFIAPRRSPLPHKTAAATAQARPVARQVRTRDAPRGVAIPPLRGCVDSP